MILKNGPAPQASPVAVRLPRRGQRKSTGGKAPRRINYIDTISVSLPRRAKDGLEGQSMRHMMSDCAIVALRTLGHYFEMHAGVDGVAVLTGSHGCASPMQYRFYVDTALLLSLDCEICEEPDQSHVTVQAYVNEWEFGVTDVLGTVPGPHQPGITASLSL
ncbi:hypothetical protein K491DRAFT_438752 [Lophiostoma macrostomum CBS 122681]|uniref:Uncharacterized protein n=1 Tax=Lophiostoma macrostomum CBS 122681 TaxID=1314788 RepID=A0A6A6T907_9PLEO|nr:hypothetical protein K491DRAFT_438752 [Lophiostoma macrostomum CBS 122681]